MSTWGNAWGNTWGDTWGEMDGAVLFVGGGRHRVEPSSNVMAAHRLRLISDDELIIYMAAQVAACELLN